MRPLSPDEVEEYMGQPLELIGFSHEDVLLRARSGEILVALLCPACEGHLAYGVATDEDIEPEKLGES